MRAGMTRQAALVTERLRRQGLIRPIHRTPEDVVAWFGAMQAQEYGPATWAIGLRMKGDPSSGYELTFSCAV